MWKKNDNILLDKHPWLESIFDIDLLLKQLIPDTWVPALTDSMNSSHFGNFEKMEEKKNKSRIRSFNNEQQTLFEDF